MSRGHDRERLVRELLELGFTPEPEPPKLFEPDPPLTPWWVCRSAGSLGDVDLVALRPGRALLVEVKSTAQSPYERFSPVERELLKDAAARAGAEAWLCWCPPSPPGVRGIHGAWIHESEWPR